MDGGHYRTTRTVRPSDREKWTEVTEIAPAVCAACESKGMTSARCRCGSKGEGRGVSNQRPRRRSFQNM